MPISPRRKRGSSAKERLIEKSNELTNSQKWKLRVDMLHDIKAYLGDGMKDIKAIPNVALEGENGKDPHGNAIQRNRMGQPTHMTSHVIINLEWAYKLGANDRQAAGWAGIDIEMLQRFFTKYPEYRQLTHCWQQEPYMQARATLVRASRTDPAVARWLIEQDYGRQMGNPALIPGRPPSDDNPGEYDFVIGVKKRAARYAQLGTGENQEEAGAETVVDAEAVEVADSDV